MTLRKDSGYCFPQAKININKTYNSLFRECTCARHGRFKMAVRLFDGLRAIFASTPDNQDLLLFAKTEYKEDWRYAYSYMLKHDGKGPKMGVKY